ncbi:MAG: PD-(D/E)XK nuclease family protein [Firmicutes bacterium]|nr:PD-(D/E)XK nuclease family protein [Bacillota bacterium]
MRHLSTLTVFDCMCVIISIHYAEIDKEKILRKETMQIFQEHLKPLFLTILDKKIAFSQTEDENNCEYCEYKSICNK